MSTPPVQVSSKFDRRHVITLVLSLHLPITVPTRFRAISHHEWTSRCVPKKPCSEQWTVTSDVYFQRYARRQTHTHRHTDRHGWDRVAAPEWCDRTARIQSSSVRPHSEWSAASAAAARRHRTAGCCSSRDGCMHERLCWFLLFQFYTSSRALVLHFLFILVGSHLILLLPTLWHLIAHNVLLCR